MGQCNTMPKPLNTNNYPAVERIKYEHCTDYQRVDFGKIIGRIGPSFFHPEISRIKFHDRAFDREEKREAAPAPLLAPGAAGR
ncbi:hypothetical protein [Legionella erythra]|uniref:Uncharacterized protein n=1 Tax=Legionella erythra TaxID=448 RepID=A0A0W0TJC9_LEGER|nr:hypothetical protein [Legionella erythra]KTC95735.1 hypothetical protein Lery_2030 [Legionella erythra]